MSAAPPDFSACKNQLLEPTVSVKFFHRNSILTADFAFYVVKGLRLLFLARR